MVNTKKYTEKDLWEILDSVMDPEIPVLSVCDLGIVRSIDLTEENCIVTITPTYSGCPAMNLIEYQIKQTLQEKGIENVTIKSILSPAWTTDWITEEGKEKLREYGIAPPENGIGKGGLLHGETSVRCPKCGSHNSELDSAFGSTACKALYRCLECDEPFEYFKCH